VRSRKDHSAAEGSVVGGSREVAAAGKVSGIRANDKEDLARSIAAKDGITSGPVCVADQRGTLLEVSISTESGDEKLDVVKRERQCLFLYHYWMLQRGFKFFHQVFGFMNARIQSWFSVSHQICLNGGNGGAADGTEPSELRTTGQLLSVGGRTGEGRNH